jgi:hypothetical protein
MCRNTRKPLGSKPQAVNGKDRREPHRFGVLVCINSGVLCRVAKCVCSCSVRCWVDWELHSLLLLVNRRVGALGRELRSCCSSGTLTVTLVSCAWVIDVELQTEE